MIDHVKGMSIAYTRWHGNSVSQSYAVYAINPLRAGRPPTLECLSFSGLDRLNYAVYPVDLRGPWSTGYTAVASTGRQPHLSGEGVCSVTGWPGTSRFQDFRFLHLSPFIQFSFKTPQFYPNPSSVHLYTRNPIIYYHLITNGPLIFQMGVSHSSMAKNIEKWLRRIRRSTHYII